MKKKHLNYDIWTKEKRSQVMALIHSRDTKPELIIRSLLHNKGYRFRLHKKNLPGKPDIVLAKYKTAIFVNGCFWHLHEGCISGKIPKGNREYWEPKLHRNVERDKQNIMALHSIGWKTVILWECEVMKNPNASFDRILAVLNNINS